MKKSPLDIWLKDNFMQTGEFAYRIGCSPPVIQKIKKGIPISSKFAKKVEKFTDGKIVPLVSERGRRS